MYQACMHEAGIDARHILMYFFMKILFPKELAVVVRVHYSGLN